MNLPSGINGRLNHADAVGRFAFAVRKGTAYDFEIYARRLGSPLDAVLEIYDAKGKLLAEADDGDLFRGKDSRLTWTAPADGQFVVAVVATYTAAAASASSTTCKPSRPSRISSYSANTTTPCWRLARA